MPRFSPAFALCAALAVASCGDPLVTGDYRGEVLLELQGRLLIRSAANTPDSLNVAVFWISPHQSLSWDLAEQPLLSQSQSLSRYTLRLYQPPPSLVLQDLGDGQRLALALIILYDDTNLDGTWDPDQELLLGGASHYSLLYTPHGLDDTLFGLPLTPGYHMMRLADEEQRCQTPGHIASMTPALGSPSINLVVFGDLNAVLPDLDCDGYVGDWCEDILTEAIAQNVTDLLARRRAAARFVSCLDSAGASAPCLDKLPPGAFFGDQVRSTELAQYQACLDSHQNDSPYAPEDECNFFLQELRWATSPQQEDELYALYEQCIQDYDLYP